MWQRLRKHLIHWLSSEPPKDGVPLCDFEKIRYDLRPGDVLLIEGRSRISEVIRQMTRSPWSHACLYIGRIHDIDNAELRETLMQHFTGDPKVQLVVEGYLGKGTIVSNIENYQYDHIRLCRPRGLSRQDAQQVIAFVINKLGTDYDVRQIFDLARFLLPLSILPRRWRSSLFNVNNRSTRTICSTLIAEAFAVINFPVLPVVKQHAETGIELYLKNPRLLTPRDFDYSPYFEIIKYPFISFAEQPYRSLPWNRQGIISHDGENVEAPRSKKLKNRSKKRMATRNIEPVKTETEADPSPSLQKVRSLSKLFARIASHQSKNLLIK